MSKHHPSRLSSEQIYWHCDPDILDFETTLEVDPAADVMGQPTAHDALLFGIQCEARGQNIYVRGSRGTGRTRMIEQLLKELQPKTDKKRDYCYVHNFKRQQSPRLITLPPGKAPEFRKAIEELAHFVEVGLRKSIDSEPYSSQFQMMQDSIEQDIREISKPMEDELAANGMALVSMQNGPVTQTAVFPVVDGQPIPPEQLRAMVAQGKASAEQLEKYEAEFSRFQKQLQETSRKVGETFREGSQRLHALREKTARTLLAEIIGPIASGFPAENVKTFLDEVIEDAVSYRLGPDSPEDEPDVE